MRLEAGGWYGWTMFPGYGDTAYHSPIKVRRVAPLRSGERLFDLDFFNMGYAQGVQDMRYRLRTLRGEPHYLVAACQDSDRSVAIMPLTRGWLRTHAPQLWKRASTMLLDGASVRATMDAISGA